MLAPEQFAEVLCDDLDLNPVNFVPAIAAAISQQVTVPSVPVLQDHGTVFILLGR
jgi:SWI/SNF-related matrix-associated actin-dependent regulator of chromatin subfamily B protein 1